MTQLLMRSAFRDHHADGIRMHSGTLRTVLAVCFCLLLTAWPVHAQEALPFSYAATPRAMPSPAGAEQPVGSAPAAHAKALEHAVSGRVTSATSGLALPGVNVLVKGTQVGASTDSDGAYQLVAPSPNDTLVFSFVGFVEQEVPIGGRSVINVSMQEDDLALDEVVVIGYGAVQRRDLTGAVSSVTSEAIERLPAPSTDQLLQGQVAGVHVTTNSSRPGGGTSVRIRGTGSITSGSEPLYVIDGVPVYNDNKSVPGTGGSSVAPNPLAGINPQDIESIEVLKDASATAIYGSRGANGVVLITTKQGRAGDRTISFSSSLGAQTPAKTFDVLTAEQYVQFANEAAAFYGLGQVFPDSPSSYETTDWQDQIYRQGLRQNYQLGVRGGNQDTRYALSGNYLNNEGIMVNSGFERYSARINLDQSVTSAFRVRANLTASRALYAVTNEGGTTYSTGASLAAASFLPLVPVFNEDGEYADQTQQVPFGSRPMENPVAWVREIDDDTAINRLLGNVEGMYDLLDNLQLRVSLGADIEELKREGYSTRRLVQISQNGSASINMRNRMSLLNENVLNYNTRFADAHELDVTAGFTWQNETAEYASLQNGDFVADITRTDDIGAGSQPGGPNVGSSRSEWTLLSWLGRANYSFRGRYLFTVTGRADGSSKFGAGNKWGVFPSGALAWRVSEEAFMQDVGLVSDLKLRASYGFSGNQEIGTYQSLARLNTQGYAFGGTEVIGYVPASVTNQELKWETSRQFDVGLDLGLFDQQVRLTADYYRKNTEDLILPVTLPFGTGFGSAIKNTGSILNEGIELALQTFVQAGAFSWTSNANFATNRNEVIDLGESDRFFGPSMLPGESEGALIEEGRPIGVFWGYETDGIINDEAERDALGYGVLGGLKIIDQNDDGAISPADYTVIGNPHPAFTYGWTNTFTYRALSLTAVVQGVYGNDVWNMNLNSLEHTDLELNSTVRRYEERWTPDNAQNATFPRAGFDQNEYSRTDFLVEDGSYLRLRTVTLGYELPAQRLGLQRLRLYVQGQNLLTITDYTGLDPDVNTFGQGSINTGFDNAAYPLAQEFTVGVDIDF